MSEIVNNSTAWRTTSYISNNLRKCF